MADRDMDDSPSPPRPSPPRYSRSGTSSPNHARASWHSPGGIQPMYAGDVRRSSTASLQSRLSFQSLGGIPEHHSAGNLHRSNSQYSISSRASYQTVNLPMVTQTGEFNRALPKGPLRIPAKNPRRSLGTASPAPVHIPTPGSVAMAYVPPSPRSVASVYYTESPAVAEQQHNHFDAPRTDSYSSEPHKLREGFEEEKEWAKNREGKCRFLLFVAIITAIIVALAVGLSVGLTHRTQPETTSSSTVGQPSGQSSVYFPAGSFQFSTALRSNSSGCTSRASTWRCSNSGDDASGYLSWRITAVGANDYSISGDDSPLIPSFSNVPMRLLDKGQPAERLVFQFSSNKTVVPQDANTPTNRAAQCVYSDTLTQGTLWTRRRGDSPITTSGTQSGDLWPGSFVINQSKPYVIGEPRCQDKSGLYIADVQAGTGNCTCQFWES